MTVVEWARLPWAVLVLNGWLPVWLGREAKAKGTASGPRPPCTVLVPAWNEAPRIGATLSSLRAQLAPSDRLIVIADNCTDDTALVARRGQRAEVWERKDPRLGKGSALAYAFERLENFSGILVVVDADSRLAPGSLDELVRGAAARGRPQQAVYRLLADGENGACALSAFAFSIVNEARPRGRARLNLPCLLNGNGMAFTAAHLAVLKGLVTTNVEDREWSVALASAGFAPELRASALVTSPAGARDWEGQHRRWERGALRLAVSAPRFLLHALWRGHWRSLVLALDLLTPPTSLMALAGLALALLDRSGGSLMLGLWALAGICLARRRDLPLRLLARGIPAWLRGKLRVYRAIALEKEDGWEREKKEARG